MISKNIYNKMRSKTGQIAVLIDPEKTNSLESIKDIVDKAEFAGIDYFFVGGSVVSKEDFKKSIDLLKSLTHIPIVIFPGDYQQNSNKADALLYLSLISGRNPEYLIGQHVKSAREILSLGIEVIPTSYILIDGGISSSVAYVSQTTPIPSDNEAIATSTAIAGYLQGKQAVYFDAGSGALQSVKPELIKNLRSHIDTVIMVGGGVKNISQIQSYKRANANVIVIGNKLEEDIDFLLDIRNLKENIK